MRRTEGENWWLRSTDPTSRCSSILCPESHILEKLTEPVVLVGVKAHISLTSCIATRKVEKIQRLYSIPPHHSQALSKGIEEKKQVDLSAKVRSLHYHVSSLQSAQDEYFLTWPHRPIKNPFHTLAWLDHPTIPMWNRVVNKKE